VSERDYVISKAIRLTRPPGHEQPSYQSLDDLDPAPVTARKLTKVGQMQANKVAASEREIAAARLRRTQERLYAREAPRRPSFL